MKEGPQCSHCGEPCRWQAALSRHRKLVMQVGSLAGRTCRGLPDCHPPPAIFLPSTHAGVREECSQSIEDALRVFLMIDTGKLDDR